MTLVPRIHASVAMALASSLLVGSVSGFSPGSVKHQTLTTRGPAPLNAFALRADSEDHAMYVMHKAKECALSDTCSIDEAKGLLREVVHVQSGCVAGTLAGHDLCEDADVVAEIVSGLRSKIERGAAVSSNFWPVSSMSSNGANLALGALCLALVASTLPHNGPVVPFTPQEVWWAARDGYLDDMVSHLVRNGGLLTSSVDPPVVPFSPQEVWWAARDGYLGDMVSHFARNGGLLVSSADPTQPTPFTPQEVMWAMRDGYLDDLVSHFMRNGGL